MRDDGEQAAPEQLDRREALKRAAAVGGALWVVPAVQSINMSRAFATSASNVCNNFRIEGGKCSVITKKTGSKCASMPYTDPSSCAPINTAKTKPISTPSGADWVICLDAGCEVEGVGLKAGDQCLYSPQNPLHHDQGLPVIPPNGKARWGASSLTWYVDTNRCLHVTRLEQKNNKGKWNTIDNSHVDVITCCPGP